MCVTNTCRQTNAKLSWQIIDKCYDIWQRFVVYAHKHTNKYVPAYTYLRTQIATEAQLSFSFPRMRSG